MASDAARACSFIGYKKPTGGEVRERSTQEQLPTGFSFARSCSMSRSMCASSRGGAGERAGRVPESGLQRPAFTHAAARAGTRARAAPQ